MGVVRIADPVSHFWSRAIKTDQCPVPGLKGGCWLWTGSTAGSQGYGRLRFNGKRIMAHRLAFILVKGPIPEGFEPDHLCRVRACINPDHLEAVTPKVNALRGESPWAKNARKTRCKNGHPLVRPVPKGCPICKKIGERIRSKLPHVKANAARWRENNKERWRQLHLAAQRRYLNKIKHKS